MFCTLFKVKDFVFQGHFEFSGIKTACINYEIIVCLLLNILMEQSRGCTCKITHISVYQTL